MQNNFEISKIEFNKTIYAIKDAIARKAISEIDIAVVITSDIEPTDTTKLWHDSTNNTLKYFDGEKWKLIVTANGFELSEIRVKTPPQRTDYKVDEVFDPTGMVIVADYSLGGQIVTEDVQITGWTYDNNPISIDQTSITITYSENGIVKTVDQPITVSRIQLTKPTYEGTLVYDGTPQTPEFLNYNPLYISLTGVYSAINAGEYQANFDIRDDCKYKYEWDDGTQDSIIVNWKINKAVPSLESSAMSINLDDDHSSVSASIITNSDGEISAVCQDTSIATVLVDELALKVDSTGNTGSTSITLSVTETNNYESKTIAITVVADFASFYGVAWDNTSVYPTSLFRMGGSTGLIEPVPYCGGLDPSQCHSPFDNIMPWAGMEIVHDDIAGELVSIPKFWYDLKDKQSTTVIRISNKPRPGFSVSPAHMDRGDGKGERDVVYVGRYHCAENTYLSTSGERPQVALTGDEFRQGISRLGDGIYLMDFTMRFTIWLLYIVEFANWDSQAKIGKGCGNSATTETMGYTDSMPYHTGTMLTEKTGYSCSTQYRNIEGLWDNVYDFMEGIYSKSTGDEYIILNPKDFSDQRPSTPFNFSLKDRPGGIPSKIKIYSNPDGYPLFYASEANGSATSGLTDYWGNYNPDKDVYYFAGGNYRQNGQDGIFSLWPQYSDYKNNGCGARLMKL